MTAHSQCDSGRQVIGGVASPCLEIIVVDKGASIAALDTWHVGCSKECSLN